MTDIEVFEPGKSRFAASLLPLVPAERPKTDETIRTFVGFGEVFWKILLEVVSYWTPRKMEQEALRRAGEAPGVSALAEEVHLLTEWYLKWLGVLLDWEHAESKVASEYRGPGLRRTVLLKAIVGETLQKLEQRSIAVEATALDLRLRVDHQRILSAIAGNEFASQIFDAIKDATTKLDSRQHIEALAQQLDDLKDLEPRFGKIEGEIAFIADRVQADFVKHELKTSVQSAAKELGKAATYGPVKAILGEIAKSVIGL